jgi:hypothetical protein
MTTINLIEENGSYYTVICAQQKLFSQLVSQQLLLVFRIFLVGLFSLCKYFIDFVYERIQG